MKLARVLAISFAAFVLAAGFIHLADRFAQSDLGCSVGATIRPSVGRLVQPRLWHPWVVWLDGAGMDRGRHTGIVHAMNLETGQVRNMDSGAAWNRVPQLYGGVVVWESVNESGNSTTVVHNLTTGIERRFPEGGFGGGGGLLGERGVSVGPYGEHGMPVRVTNFSTGDTITVTARSVTSPALSLRGVYWMERSAEGAYVAKEHRFGATPTTRVLGTSEGYGDIVALGDVVVYEGHENGRVVLYYQDLTTLERRIIGRSDPIPIGTIFDPDYDGRWVVWYESRSTTDNRLWGFDPVTNTTRIITRADLETAASVHGSEVVYARFNGRTEQYDLVRHCL